RCCESGLLCTVRYRSVDVGRLRHLSQRVVSVPYSLSNLQLQFESRFRGEIGEQFERVLEHVNGVLQSISSGGIFRYKDQVGDGPFIFATFFKMESKF